MNVLDRRIGLAMCVALMATHSDVQAQSPTGAESLIGIWASESTFRPAVLGELTVSRKGAGWHATLSTAETTLRVTSDSLRFSFPDHPGRAPMGSLMIDSMISQAVLNTRSSPGSFRGAVTDDGRAITGFWLQPSGVTKERPNPTGSRQAFATPLVLRRTSPDVWRGTVRPLEERFTLYLKIDRDAEGRVVGAFRNPEINSNGGASLFRVSREGDRVLLFVPRGATQPAIPGSGGASHMPPQVAPLLGHSATFMRSPDRLRIFWPDVGRHLDLVRRTPQQAPNFFPRPPGKAYAYQKPPVTGDGWPTARAGEVGIDETALARLVQRLGDADPSARRPSLIHSLLVARRGNLVLEEYFFGFDRERPHDTRSAGKTFASVMLGAAMMQDVKIAPETKVYDLLAGMGPFANPDPRKSRITLAHLMTHTAGFACDDNNDASPGNENTLQTQQREPNWWKYTLDLPMAHEPGSRYAYCSANMNLMGAALTTATRTWLPELFERTVARPLQFGTYHWNLMPTEEGYLGGGSWLRPRDLLKIGQAYLDGGVWRGRRIVGADWVTRSTAPHMRISPATTGLDAEQFADSYIAGDDAYAWHLGGVRSGERSYRAYEATGNGGQILMVVPEFDLVVVFTGGNYRQGGIWLRWRDEIVGGEIIPAIRDKQ